MTESLPPPDPPALECLGLQKSFGEVQAVDGVSLTVGPGELLALLGPSGCGKTTTLRLIAGFEPADAGSLRIGGRVVMDERTSLPPEARRLGMVFQDYALFPHLTVAANVRYGLDSLDLSQDGAAGEAGTGQRLRSWARRHLPAGGADPDERVAAALQLVSLHGMADHYPHELSGGEAQRVALARALAPRPDLILLDEPFSNLDTRLRASVRAEVREILRRAGAAAVFVTHDQEEAFSLADRVAVMWAGRIAQVGSAAEIYRRPATRALAEFVGDADFLPGEAANGVVTTEMGPAPTSAPGVDGAVEAMLRPETVQLLGSDAPGTDDPLWVRAEVIDREYYGHDQMLAVRLPTGRRVHVRLGTAENYQVGDPVRVRAVGPLVVFPAARR